MLVSIHQPEFMPWAPLFDKIMQADRFVFLDSVKFQKNYFINRCRIKQRGEPHWLTVPVKKGSSSDRICDKHVGEAPTWGKKCFHALYFNYRRAPFWRDHEEFLERTFVHSTWERLVALNMAALDYVCHYLSIDTGYEMSSRMSVEGAGTELLISICERLGAERYLSGAHGGDYLDEAAFADRGIGLVYQHYSPPTYAQFDGEWCGPLSVLDLLFNRGRDSRDLIAAGRNQ